MKLNVDCTAENERGRSSRGVSARAISRVRRSSWEKCGRYVTGTSMRAVRLAYWQHVSKILRRAYHQGAVQHRDLVHVAKNGKNARGGTLHILVHHLTDVFKENSSALHSPKKIGGTRRQAM